MTELQNVVGKGKVKMERFADIETYSGEFAFRGDLAGVTLQVIHILQISF